MPGGAPYFAGQGFDSGCAGPYHARAMGNPLRDRRTPSELAESGQVIEFKEKLDDFTRLAAVVEADLAALDPATLPADWRAAPVSGRLVFGFAAAQNRLPVLDGRAAVTLDAVCQRCLEPFRWSLDVPMRLLFGAAGSGATEAADYELWELPEATFTPLEVVDELLVMAMPLAAMHDGDAECGAPQEKVDESTGKIRPFAALKAQMDTDKQD